MNAPNDKPLSHEQCQLLIPSYINGRLSGNQSRAMQEHIAHCEPCFAEQQIAQQAKEALLDDPEPLADLLRATTRKSNLDKVMARIADVEQPVVDRPEQQPSSATREGGVGAWSAIAELFARIAQSWQLTPLTIKSLCLAQAMGLAVGLALLNVERPEEIAYRTFTDNTPADQITVQNAAKGFQIFRVVFHPKSTEQDVRQLLLDLRGQITGGPSMSGVYTLAVGMEQSSEAVISSLRQSPWVEFAEPVIYLNADSVAE